MFIRRGAVPRKRKKHFLFPTQEMGAKTQDGGLLDLYWRPGGIYLVKDNGSGWLKWLTK
jgi:hypothetical protein